MEVLFGRVIQGKKYGRKLGFPTANLDRRDYSSRKMKIRLGIYAGWAMVDGHLLDKPQKMPIKGAHRAAIVIGPIDNRGLPKIEAHLIGFKGNLYGKKIVISLQKFIRPFRKFTSEKDLKLQIHKDITKVKKLIRL